MAEFHKSNSPISPNPSVEEIITRLAECPRRSELRDPFAALLWVIAGLQRDLWARHGLEEVPLRNINREGRRQKEAMIIGLGQLQAEAHERGGRAGLGPIDVDRVLAPVVSLAVRMLDWNVIPRPHAEPESVSDIFAQRDFNDSEEEIGRLVSHEIDPALAELSKVALNIRGRLQPTEIVSQVPGNVKVTKGKDIDGRMTKLMFAKPESLGWTASEWATHLGCSKGTVGGTKTWKRLLKAAREVARAEASGRMDRSRTQTAKQKNRVGRDD